MEGDRSINTLFTLYLNEFFFVKEREKKKKRKLEVIDGEGDENDDVKNNQEVIGNSDGKTR